MQHTMFHSTNHIHEVFPYDYNGAEKFLWSSDILAVEMSPHSTLLICCGKTGINKPNALPVI